MSHSNYYFIEKSDSQTDKKKIQIIIRNIDISIV